MRKSKTLYGPVHYIMTYIPNVALLIIMLVLMASESIFLFLDDFLLSIGR